MTVLSGRNTKISKSRLGCRLPYETAGVGDGYAGAGPVKTYFMPLEEVERKYGPAKKSEWKRPIMLQPGQKERSGRKKKEVSEMASIMEMARKVLPKEKLGPLLASGKTNKEIGMAHGGLPHWAVNELKKEYWPGNTFNPDDYKEADNVSFETCLASKEVTGGQDNPVPSATPDPKPAENKPNEVAEVPVAEVPKYTISELVEQYKTAKADAECISKIYALMKKCPPGVDKLLSEHKSRCEAQVAILERVFTQTLIEVPGE